MIRHLLPGLIVGLIFGAGLALSDMINPARVLAFLDVAGRLAHILLDLSKKPDAQQHPRGRVVRISRQELARNAGCSREMAGRVLKKLEEDGLVRDAGEGRFVAAGD